MVQRSGWVVQGQYNQPGARVSMPPQSCPVPGAAAILVADKAIGGDMDDLDRSGPAEQNKWKLPEQGKANGR